MSAGGQGAHLQSIMRSAGLPGMHLPFGRCSRNKPLVFFLRSHGELRSAWGGEGDEGLRYRRGYRTTPSARASSRPTRMPH